MIAYRLLTGKDDAEFCHKVTKALNNGWQLHGSPSITYDSNFGTTKCAQAVIKEVEGTYTPETKLGEL